MTPGERLTPQQMGEEWKLRARILEQLVASDAHAVEATVDRVLAAWQADREALERELTAGDAVAIKTAEQVWEQAHAQYGPLLLRATVALRESTRQMIAAAKSDYTGADDYHEALRDAEIVLAELDAAQGETK